MTTKTLIRPDFMIKASTFYLEAAFPDNWYLLTTDEINDYCMQHKLNNHIKFADQTGTQILIQIHSLRDVFVNFYEIAKTKCMKFSERPDCFKAASKEVLSNPILFSEIDDESLLITICDNLKKSLFNNMTGAEILDFICNVNDQIELVFNRSFTENLN